MTIAAWIAFAVLLTFFFNKVLMNQKNPNSNVVTNYTGMQKEVVLLRNRFGHYVADGIINGHEVVFLLDTGATDVAIPLAIAERLSLKKGRSMHVQTANGIALAWDTQLDEVAIGDILLRDVDASILQNYNSEQILLGMSFLKKLELIQKGSSLTIRQ